MFPFMRLHLTQSLLWVVVWVAFAVYSWPVITGSAEAFSAEAYWHFLTAWAAVVLFIWLSNVGASDDDHQPGPGGEDSP